MKPEHHTTVYLDRNESQFGPAPECFEILRRATRTELSQYSRDFARGVKSILSETLAREFDLAEPDVLLSYGSEDMLKQMVHCYLGKGETLMIPQHSWWYYKSVAGEAAGNIVEYPMYSDRSKFYYNIDEVISLVNKIKPRILLFASPNNPTGNSLTLDEVKKLLAGCPGTYFVIDEAYFGFTDQPLDALPRLTLTNPHLAVLRTFSKLYALAGVRIGYAFVGKEYKKLVTFSARYLGYNLLSEQLALAAHKDTAYYRALAATMAKERERYYEFFRSVDGCTAFHTDANFVLVKFKSEDVEPLKKRLNDAGLVIKFFSEKEFPNHARITIGRPEQNSLLIAEMQRYFSRENILVSAQG